MKDKVEVYKIVYKVKKKVIIIGDTMRDNYGNLNPIIEGLAREENCKVNDIELIEDYKGRIFREYE